MTRPTLWLALWALAVILAVRLNAWRCQRQREQEWNDREFDRTYLRSADDGVFGGNS